MFSFPHHDSNHRAPPLKRIEPVARYKRDPASGDSVDPLCGELPGQLGMQVVRAGPLPRCNLPRRSACRFSPRAALDRFSICVAPDTPSGPQRRPLRADCVEKLPSWLGQRRGRPRARSAFLLRFGIPWGPFGRSLASFLRLQGGTRLWLQGGRGAAIGRASKCASGANSISTLFRCRREVTYSSVVALARAMSRAPSWIERGTLRAGSRSTSLSRKRPYGAH